MKNKIHILLSSIFMLLIFTGAFSQDKYEKERLDRTFKASSYIFEGKLLSSKAFIAKNKGIYTSCLIEITEVIKGNLSKGTVEIIQAGGTVGANSTSVTHSIDVPSSPAVYFAKNEEEGATDTTLVTSNKTTIIIQDVVPFSNNNIYDHSIGFRKYFTEVTALYDYLHDNYGTKVDKSIYEKKSLNKNEIEKNVKPNNSSKEKKVKYKVNVSNYNKYIEQRQQNIKNKKNAPNNTTAAGCSELFMSEYVDGPNKNKAIEIYNPTNSTKSLTDYSLRVFQNGAPSPLIIPLVGNIPPQGTFVVAHPLANASILSHADQTDVKMNFNGDDAVVLQKQNTHIDKIGEVGVNPGNSGWNVPPNGSTTAHDLKRKFPIDKGDTSWPISKNGWEIFPPDSIQRLKQHQNACVLVVNDLTLAFTNQQVTGTTIKYFEFDVVASANNNSTYFDNALMRISYNPVSFGNNVVANGAVTITKGATYNSLTYIDPQSNAIDQASNEIGVPFGTDFGQSSWNRTLVTTTPTQLLHVKIKILNCSNAANIDFADQSFTPLFSYYTTTANDNITNGIGYDNTNYGSSLNDVMPCPISITDFTSPVNAGVGDILTITGTNFGNTRGSGQVKFVNADNCCGTRIQKLNNIDYLSWSDTQIQIKVPYQVDSIVKQRIGGGDFIVKNSAGDSVLSSQNLSGNNFIVYYAIQNASNTGNGYQKYKLNNINDNNNGGYTIRTNFAGSTNPAYARGCVAKAIREWKCLTAANIVLGSDTVFSPFGGDNINYIKFSSSLLPNIPASTIQQSSTCFATNNAYQTEFDTDINNSYTWQYDTTGASIGTGNADFYGLMLHEIGHMILLGHVNDPFDVMFWQSYNGPLSPSSRVSLSPFTSHADGGIYSVSSSAGVIYSGGCVINAMQPSNTSCTVGIKELFHGVSDFNVYPNPTNYDFVNLSYDLKEHNDLTFSLIDLNGKTILDHKPNNSNIGYHQEKINLSELASGIYFIRVASNGEFKNFKLIKM